MMKPEAGPGIPLPRFVTIISLATGAVRDLAIGPCRGKTDRGNELAADVVEAAEGRAILAWRSVFWLIFRHRGVASAKNIDGVFRMHQRRKIDFHRGRCLGVTDHQVLWQKPKRPEWMDEANLRANT